MITELRRCKTQTVVPMIREERTIREVDSGVYWEYGIAAVTAAIATYAFIRPEAFATPLINQEGEIIRDKSAGYMSGGVFSGIAALSLGGGIYDTIRSRDSVEYSDAEARVDGPEGPCARPEAPWSRHSVALIFADGAALGGMTDAEGRVVFSLPAFAEGPPAATPEGPEKGKTPETPTTPKTTPKTTP
ncbi:MAG: hypothetical protein KC486_13685, partial [Myxococcales bacterium]|nr:hypothetical protein [Myxococcales bacterium]